MASDYCWVCDVHVADDDDIAEVFVEHTGAAGMLDQRYLFHRECYLKTVGKALEAVEKLGTAS